MRFDEATKKQDMFLPALIVGTLFFFAIFLLLWKSYVIVSPGHRGVRVTLGSVSAAAVPEGFTLKAPFISRVYLIPVQQLTREGKAATFSSDLQTVIVGYTILYRIPDTKVVELFQQYAGDPYDSLVVPRAQEAIKQVAAQYKAEDLVKNRDVIKQGAFDRVRAALGGMLEIRDLVVTNIDLTDELEKAIELKQVTEQQAQAKEYELRKAQKDAEITVVQARAEAEAVRIKGEAIAQAPRVIELEIAKKWDGKAPASVVTAAGGASVLLPLR